MGLLPMTLTSSMTTGPRVSEAVLRIGTFIVDIAEEEILHAFLPEELREGAPTGFAMVGHIGKSLRAVDNMVS